MKRQILKYLPVMVPVMLSFFVMGFVDLVGVATSYVKQDFKLSESMANLLPMAVFLWFAVCSLPTGLLLGRFGRKKTVALSFLITATAMVVLFLFHNHAAALSGFALLGIGNTVLQVAISPWMASVVSKDKLASTLTLGQFIKAISSFMGPILTGMAASFLGNWRLIFVLYFCVITTCTFLLINSAKESNTSSQQESTLRSVLALLKNRYLALCSIVIILIVGIDVALNTSIPKLIMERTHLPLNKATLGTSLYFAARTIGTLAGAFLLIKYSPVRLLKMSIVVAVLAFAGLLLCSSLWMLIILIIVIGIACANIFPIIFTLAMRQDMEHSNEISALMVMGISGGALLSPLQGLLADVSNFDVGLIVILAALLTIAVISFKMPVVQDSAHVQAQ